MKQWEIGITDNPPSTWEKLEPLWEDEKIVATSEDSFLELMAKLCETAIPNRREYAGDGGIHDHLWKLTIKSYKEMVNPPDPYNGRMARVFGVDYENDEDSDESDDEEDGYRGTTIIRCPQELEFGDEDMMDDGEDDPDVISADSELDDGVFPVGSVMKVTYDYGTTTEFYLKVLSVQSTAVRSLLQYFSLEAKASDCAEEMKKVPAYSLHKDKQIDHFYPNFSRAFLGHYVPVLKTKGNSRDFDNNGVDSEDEDYYINISKKAIASASMGLSSCVSSEDDTTFCTMENRTSSSDLLFCPGRFEINELLQIGEKAWTPVHPKKDKNGLGGIRYDSIARWGIPPGDDKAFARFKKLCKQMGPWGPKFLLVRLSKNRKGSEFQFEKVFPKTYQMLQSGKFRWFQYKKGVLRVIVGRGVGHDHRGFESDQILNTFKYDFESFHELLCAVEASWVHQGKAMTADTIISKFDSDLGPSNPLPKEAEVVASKKETLIVSKCQNKEKLVTALAMSEDPDGKPVLYSGHDDGSLTKWNLQDNTEVWSKQFYKNQLDKWEERGDYSLHIRDTPGVAGLTVRPDPNHNGQHLVYTWTNGDACDAPKGLVVRSGTDGKFVREHVLSIGDDDATPDISTVVFCPLRVDGKTVDTVLVGLHCECSVLRYDQSYSNFDLKRSQKHSEGNILPLFEHPTDGRGSMDSWRGHEGMIGAMAVVQDKFLLSYSIQPGHGRADAMILWDLCNPGVPLFRKDLTESRLYEVCGISVCGNDVLFADKCGMRVAAAKVKEEGTFGLEGYAQTGRAYEDDGFHGRMAMSHAFAAVANESKSTVWLYKINGNSEHPKLDREDGNLDDYSEDDDSESGGPAKWVGREIAVGKVKLPKFGGNAPSSKRQKRDNIVGESSNIAALLAEDSDGGLGNGGPIALAMRGKNLITGYANGTIVNTRLPDRFNEETECVSANHLSSCSALASDEWHKPFLTVNR